MMKADVFCSLSSCVFEATENNTPFSVNAVLSRNGGQTWGERRRVYTAPNNREAGAPWVVNVGGTLVVSFMTNEEQTFAGVDGGHFKVVTNSDGTAGSWSSKTTIAGPEAHWPAMLTLNETNFLAIYSKNGLGLVSLPCNTACSHPAILTDGMGWAGMERTMKG
jgi:hypothetical protein